MKNEAINRKYVKTNVFIYIILSYILTWLYFVPKVLFERNIIEFKLPQYFEIIAAFGPALAAVIVIYKISGKTGINQLFKRIYLWKIDLKWYLIALFLQPLIWLSALCFNVLIGGGLPNYSNIYFFRYLSFNNIVTPLYGITLLLISFFTQFISLLGEEIGWRGFMLPKLLSIKNWIYSSIVVGIVWAIWHLPLFYITNTMQSNIPFSLYFIDLMATTFIFTWIFFHTKGSILIAGLFHASINASTAIIPILPYVVGDNMPYVLGILIKITILSCLILKYRNHIVVKYTGNEGVVTKQIGAAIGAVFSFFEKIVQNIYKNN